MNTPRALSRHPSALRRLASAPQPPACRTQRTAVTWGRGHPPAAETQRAPPGPRPHSQGSGAAPRDSSSAAAPAATATDGVTVSVRAADGSAAATAWDSPGPAAFDFRSDTSTRPGPSMLRAIALSSLGDDVLREDAATAALEAHVAGLLGHEAGLFALSGTQANQVAVRAHLGAPPHSVVADARAHVLAHEAGGLSALSQAQPVAARPSNGRYLRVADVAAACVPDDGDTHLAPTRLVVLETPLGGAVTPPAEVAAIVAWARARGIATHVDGARLWDAAAAAHRSGQAASLEGALRACAGGADSVTVCFSKGLGAPAGSVLVGPAAWVRRARHLRKMLGGGGRMVGVLAAPARVAIDEGFFGGGVARAHRLAAHLGAAWERAGGRLAEPVETGMVWLDVAGSGVLAGALRSEADKEGLLGYWEGDVVRVVCHFQISDDALARLGSVFERVLAERSEAAGGKPGSAYRYGGSGGS